MRDRGWSVNNGHGDVYARYMRELWSGAEPVEASELHTVMPDFWRLEYVAGLRRAGPRERLGVGSQLLGCYAPIGEWRDSYPGVPEPRALQSLQLDYEGKLVGKDLHGNPFGEDGEDAVFVLGCPVPEESRMVVLSSGFTTGLMAPPLDASTLVSLWNDSVIPSEGLVEYLSEYGKVALVYSAETARDGWVAEWSKALRSGGAEVASFSVYVLGKDS